MQFCGVKVESELNISMICGGGSDAEQNFSESKWMRSQKMRLFLPRALTENAETNSSVSVSVVVQ